MIVVIAALPEVNLTAFGGGNGNILRRNWRCSGTENKLVECTTDEVPTCSGQSGHNSAGIYCFGKVIVVAWLRIND